MFRFRDAVLLLLSWDKPLDTAVAMVVYGIVCMYPRWLLLVPHAILLSVLLSNYQKKKQHQLRAAREGSPEYLKNMMNLQNMMGEVSDAYDAVAMHAHWVDWTDEQLSLQILQATLGSGLVIALTVWFVPIQLLALFGGWAVFLSNTRLAKYIWRELGPEAIALGEHKMKEAGTWYTTQQQQQQEQDHIKTVSLYENQRWWEATGFAPQVRKDLFFSMPLTPPLMRQTSNRC
ncbi:Peroxin/Dysferlin domain-containing protein [Dichotomocladium elegans]|nr:Peroxin/Dysferlin domain-containing protein [Dichotomocladium elegans]